MDKTIMHLFILSKCDHQCKLCCNNQYNIDEISVATVEELKTIDTLCITGGEPFLSKTNLDMLAYRLKKQYSNIKKIYVYTSGSALYRHFPQTLNYIDGVNIAPKNKRDWESLRGIRYHMNYLVLSDLKDNRLYVFKDQLSQMEEYKHIVDDLHLNIINRKWVTTFNTPENEIFRRLPILLDY